jgi:hypothetical protein
MRIRNLSALTLPVNLWRELAHTLLLDGTLPGAVADDIGMYTASGSLELTVRPRGPVAASEVVTTGDYTSGRVRLFPCPDCTVGSLTHVLLHELVHAWLHQYHEDLYYHLSCDLAESFADAAFLVLGGKIRPRRLCGSYSLGVAAAERRLPLFHEFAATLITARPSEIMQWQPPAALGKQWCSR